MANVIVLQEVWANKLAQRLDKPTNWKETCDVVYSDTQTYVLPYISTGGEPAVSATYLTNEADRSTLSKVVTLIDVTMSTETLQILTTNYDAVYVDYASQAQSNYAKIADLGALLGKKLQERVESIIGANHDAWTNFGDTGGGVLGLASTAIAVNANNVDDIVRGVIEQIYTANGFDLYRENGGFISWTPAQWTFMVQFMQANGFNLADASLKNGGQIGIDYLGLFHYVTTLGTSAHTFAGVRKIQKLGLLKDTWGRIYTTETPSSSTAGFLSGTAIHARLDYGLKVQTNVKPVVFDINTA
jgi:hypothetical protein